MKYHKLGKLPLDTVDFFYKEITKRKQPNVNYQWIQFDDFLYNEFLKIFVNTELEIQHSRDKTKKIQKAFYSEPGHGFRIHKDGLNCKSALNIAISCNETDYVRWYDENLINNIAKTKISNPINNSFGYSRNTDIFDYDDIPYTDELKNEIGDVYVLDVDSYHSFKCIGNKPRIIIQTKFEGFPTIDVIKKSLTDSSFSNLII